MAVDRHDMEFMELLVLFANDAHNEIEHQQIGYPIVKIWLDELREAIYDAQDLMGKINARALQRKLEHGSTPPRLRNFITFFITSKKLMKEMEEIRGNLQLLMRVRRKDFDNGSVEKMFLSKEPSTSDVDEEYFGRDADKEAVIKLLLSESDENNISVIPIVGMAGIGKTTLAKIVYNGIDNRIMDRPFDIKFRVHVSNQFDLLETTKLLAEKVTGQDFDRGESLNVIHKTLVKALRMKKFLLVLDDILFENLLQHWYKFKSTFQWAKHGSKIIVTTQNNQVAKTMGNLPFYHLRTMSHEDSWQLFQRYAFEDVNLCVHPDLEIIGRQIVEKCLGLPLAVKSLGCLLRYH